MGDGVTGMTLGLRRQGDGDGTGGTETGWTGNGGMVCSILLMAL